MGPHVDAIDSPAFGRCRTLFSRSHRCSTAEALSGYAEPRGRRPFSSVAACRLRLSPGRRSPAHRVEEGEAKGGRCAAHSRAWLKRVRLGVSAPSRNAPISSAVLSPDGWRELENLALIRSLVVGRCSAKGLVSSISPGSRSPPAPAPAAAAAASAPTSTHNDAGSAPLAVGLALQCRHIRILERSRWSRHTHQLSMSPNGHLSGACIGGLRFLSTGKPDWPTAPASSKAPSKPSTRSTAKTAIETPDDIEAPPDRRPGTQVASLTSDYLRGQTRVDELLKSSPP